MNITNEDRLSCSVHMAADGAAVEILDQTRLPNETVYLRLNETQEMVSAIKSLAVRGAPAIGIFAGYAVYVRALALRNLPMAAFREQLHQEAETIAAARPTAVNLSWAVRRMLERADACATVGETIAALQAESLAIHDEDIEMCYHIAEYGLSLVQPGDGILTHCNAGPLATSKYGTALGPLFLGRERGIDFHVFSDETRPLLQGARLTSYELQKAGIDVTLICDNMASIVMKQGWVQAVFVGCDRIAANGDFANKIGTSGVAILAKHYGIPFYTLGPRSTIDLACPTGDDIHIEQRDPDEIRTMWYSKPMALPEVRCYNPAFDVTDHSLVTAIVTDRGIVRPPFDVNLRRIMEMEA